MNSFLRSKERILRSFKDWGKCGFCSSNCLNKSKKNKVDTNCKECGKDITVAFYTWKKNKNNNCFCGYSCCAKFNNKNKATGYNRSKMEIYLEAKIKEKYPLLNMICNDNKALSGLELDFYFPDLKLGIELNGITHYEPIYGLDRFTRSQDSDKRKMIGCFELGIELAVIDISSYKYFSEKSGDVVFNEISKILSPLYKYSV